MIRSVDALTSRRWDLLVVGGGIHGLFAAYDAAQRGLAVALVDAGDFGSGLSFNHQRTLHGGLRALQTGHIAKVREQVAERRTWARLAPHLIRPLSFLVGTYGHGMRSRLAVAAGFRLYDFLGRRRNDEVPAELHLPRTRMESPATTRKLFPGIAEAGLTGGAIWYDYQTVHPDRLTWLVACAAADAGATLVNYVRVAAPEKTGARITGVQVVDAISHEPATLASSVVLLAAGSGLPELHRTFSLPDAPPLLRAMNLLFDRPTRDIALAARGSSGRMLTLVPWRGAALVGTHQSSSVVQAGEAAPSPADLDEFLSDVRAAFPALQADRDAIALVHHGLVPAANRPGRIDLLPEPLVVSHRRIGVPGVVSLVGVKYTTARLAAARAVDEVCDELGCPRASCRTGAMPLPSAGISDVEGRTVEATRELGISLDPRLEAHLNSWYGTEAPAVLAHAAGTGGLDPLPGSEVLSGEISYAARELAAVRLADVVFRRTSLGSAGHPGQAALQRAAAIMTRALGWDAPRTAQELAEVEARYALTSRRTP